ncbi:vacuolar import and degradation protein-domain-containing protein [Radiomyces spectabilis]|uniref:vacuolar import and degradation protein-domain-containing protein n=1 Tax=Radiomyces spectabilis TaxID=64574 RepID=UPI002220F601|nr:vacuolar import and degradation protein-domain-containing protein [Radiomyces spectabilis]KAI8374586.1 vacuolar import and degradation protein-domain-containing protein [Radiomyces spectabilis]
MKKGRQKLKDPLPRQDAFFGFPFPFAFYYKPYNLVLSTRLACHNSCRFILHSISCKEVVLFSLQFSGSASMPIPSNGSSIYCDNKAPDNLQACKSLVRKYSRKQPDVADTKNKRSRTLLHNQPHDSSEDIHPIDLSQQRLRNSHLGALYAGSVFKGIQKCAQMTYEVTVEIQHVDLSQSRLCGYLNIKGLTSQFPELTTYFEGEIIGPRYPFLTRKWQAQQSIDMAHWKRFPSFRPYIPLFNLDGFTYDPTDKDFVYMRWKEQFLIPDHRVDTIEGASFAGFYYICYQRSTNHISGFYFFRYHTEWYQELTLDHVEQRYFGNFEFH